MVTICQVCGDHGFEEALICCESCELYAVHRYCLERMPRDFKKYISWFCEDCDGDESVSDNVEIDQTGNHGLNLKRNEKKKNFRLNEKNKRSRSGSSETLARVEDCTLERGTDVEPMEVCSTSIHETSKDSGRQGCFGGGRYENLTGSKRNQASISKASIASTVAEHDSSANKETKLTPGSCDDEFDFSKTITSFGAVTDPSNIPMLPYDNRQLTVRKTSKVAESSKPVSKRLAGKCFSTPEPYGDVRALPIIKPVWRGSLSAKLGTYGSVYLVAHLSHLACSRVYVAARSLPKCICAEIYPRLDIWPQSFLRSGGPSDESIGLFFFPISGSDEKIFDALVDELIKKDLAVRIVLDNAELLLFTSYVLPMQSWRLQSKFYLWGAFRGKQASRHQSLPSVVTK